MREREAAAQRQRSAADEGASCTIFSTTLSASFTSFSLMFSGGTKRMTLLTEGAAARDKKYLNLFLIFYCHKQIMGASYV